MFDDLWIVFFKIFFLNWVRIEFGDNSFVFFGFVGFINRFYFEIVFYLVRIMIIDGFL